MFTEKPESEIENNAELRKYTYRDNSAGGVVIFECVAKGILEADKLYQEKTGKNPEKQNHVGCSIEKLEKDLKIEFPEGLTDKDMQLILQQCENQDATSKKQIEGFATAYKLARDLVSNLETFINFTAEDVEGFILHLAELIEERNQKGYRLVPVSFFGGGTALKPELIPQAMKSYCRLYANGIMEPTEAYNEFEKIHPFEDGNGRLGDLLWKMYLVRNTGLWPNQLPPKFINQAENIPSKIDNPELIERFVETYANELEEMVTDPRQRRDAFNENEISIVSNFRKDRKIPASHKWFHDLFVRVAQDFRFTHDEIERLKKMFME
ncbi:MAG TPA: Fic family protein [Candidatus Paceibacterota bacterium]